MIKIIQLKIILREIKPEIWRRILVNANISFEELHYIIQEVMGWENYHLWEFNINESIISPPDEEGFNPAEGTLNKLTNSSEFIKMLENQDLSKGSASIDITKVNKILEKINKRNKIKEQLGTETPITQLINKEGIEFIYRYDFGDSWEHKIIVEKIIPDRNQKVPVCLGGERACPPEDCGGTSGYKRFIEILKTGKDPHGENPKELKEWLGVWNPEEFDLNKINKNLINFK